MHPLSRIRDLNSNSNHEWKQCSRNAIRLYRKVNKRLKYNHQHQLLRF